MVGMTKFRFFDWIEIILYRQVLRQLAAMRVLGVGNLLVELGIPWNSGYTILNS